MIAPFPRRRRPIAKRPLRLRVHIAENLLRRREEVRTVRAFILTQFPRAVLVVRTRDQMGEYGQAGAFAEAGAAPRLSGLVDSVVFDIVGAGGREAGVPERDLLGFVDFGACRVVADGVGLEEHCGPGAVELWVGVVVGCEVGEVLHVDLQGPGGDSVAVVAVDPCACCLRSG